MQNAANIAKVKGELQTLQFAIETYYSNQTTKAYPATSALVASSKLITSSPQVISVAPYDPFGLTATAEFNYTLAPDNNYYVAWSLGSAGTGTASIVSGGTVTVGGGVICVTNGTSC